MSRRSLPYMLGQATGIAIRESVIAAAGITCGLAVCLVFWLVLH